MDLQMKNRVYLVSGGSTGIGKEIVLSLIQEEAKVATFARNKEMLNQLYDELPEVYKKNLYVFECDVLDKEKLSEMIPEVLKFWGRLDGIVVNAGTGINGRIRDASYEDLMDQYSIKVFGLLNTINPAIEELKKSDAARIIIINGITAHRPDVDMAAVSIARGALKQATDILTKDLFGDVNINTINLGVINTERQQSRYKKAKSKLSYKNWMKAEVVKRGIPMGRFGEPCEVSPMVLMLLSPTSSYITGSTIDITGGLGLR